MTKKQNKQLLRIIVSTTLLIGIFFITKISMPWYIKTILYFIPYIIVGFNVLKKAVQNIISGQMLDENFLMTIATIGAFILNEKGDFYG